jgi:hypothetical protein
MEQSQPKTKGPLTLVNMMQPYTQKFSSYDLFFDNFSNALIFHKDGYFVVWDEFDRIK